MNADRARARVTEKAKGDFKFEISNERNGKYKDENEPGRHSRLKLSGPDRKHRGGRKIRGKAALHKATARANAISNLKFEMEKNTAKATTAAKRKAKAEEKRRRE
jgi:hypothetical protein